MRTWSLVSVVVLALATGAGAQMHHRLKGSIRTTANVPLANATIRADAVTGFRGEPFAGAKEQSTTSLPTGEWNITNLEAGLWMFSSRAPGMLPAVIVIPVKFSQRQQVSAIGNSLTWQLPLWATPANEHPMLKVAADIAEGKNDEGMQALTVALGPEVPDETRVAAGELALLGLEWEAAGKIMWDARDLAPKEQRQALAAAIDDLRAIARVQ